MKTRLFGYVPILIGGLLAGSRANAQQQSVGTIAGTVTDVDGKFPVGDATVLVEGTNRAARTDQQGHYQIRAVPVGAQQVRAYRLGYTSVTQPITVSAGGSVSLDFTLHAVSTTLSQVVITGTSVQAQQARENGSSIGVIPLDSINPTPITDFSELLQARVAGVSAQELSGTVGTATKLIVRGAGTVALSDQPLIIIDGVRAYNDIAGLSDLGGVGGQGTSRFDDLDREDIEDVQILKGASAEALYGTEAAAGVVVIQTRHGAVGQSPTWHAFGTLGSLTNQTDFPANWGRGVASKPTASCSLLEEFETSCTGGNGPLGATKAFSYNLVDNSPTIFSGYDEGTGASLQGGSPTVTYYVGANWDREQGVYHDNADRWTHVSSAFALHPYSALDLSMTAQYTQRRTVLPLGDNAFGGVLTADLLGGPGPGLYAAGLTPQAAEGISNNSNVDRFTVGTTGTLRALSWLTFHGTIGLDYLTEYDSYFYSQVVLPSAVTPTGAASDADNAIYQYTGSVSGVAAYQPFRTIKATTSVGGEWQEFTLRQAYGAGQELLPGTSNLAGATSNYTAYESDSDIVDIGGFLQQTVNWRDVLYLSASARVDGNSAFGRSSQIALFPSGSISYVVSDEKFWPHNDIVSSLRARVAGGQTGVAPFASQARGSFAAGGYNVLNAGSQIALLPNTYANANLKPERSTEYESGIDVGIARERATLTFTVYDKTERNLVQAIPVDISTGIGGGPPGTAVYSNIGAIDNRGLELGLSGNVFRTNAVAFDLGTNFYLERNKIINLGGPAVVVTPGFAGNLQFDSTGYPLGGYFTLPYTYQDRNHDGIIEPNEVTFGSKPVYVGESGPREELTFAPTVTLFKYLKVNALFDRRDGMTIYDGTDGFRCFAGFQSGRECNDPTAPLKDQAAAIAENGGFLGLGEASDLGYLANGSFWKWREMSIALTLPDSWSRRYLGGHSAQITFSGRNLATWTNYRGLDPEVSSFGGGFNPAVNEQFFTQPPLRYWLGRIDLSW